MDRIDDVERASSSDGKKDHEIVQTHAKDEPHKKLSLSKRIASVVWDSLDKTPEERKFIAKIDWWILSYCTISYWGKYMCQQNVRLQSEIATAHNPVLTSPYRSATHMSRA